MNEIKRKALRLREAMSRQGARAIRLKGVDWFSWATCGGNSVVILTNEMGIAEVLVTEDRLFVLTDAIEKQRLTAEELPPEFEVISRPWDEPNAKNKVVRDLVPEGLILSDRPTGEEQALSAGMISLRLALEPEEIERYRVLGQDSAIAMTEALKHAQPDWTEQQLAGAGAAALWKRGIHPTLTLVAGAVRLEKYRHPFPTHHPLGHRAMMVFCARRHGLYANLTRFVSFAQPTELENKRMDIVAKIEAVAFQHSRPGRPLHEIYVELKAAYADLGYNEEATKQHFGGMTGYKSREFFAKPLALNESIVSIQAESVMAWNPTLPGSKIEDTVLVTKHGELEVLTKDPAWPTFHMQGMDRPDVMVKA